MAEWIDIVAACHGFDFVFYLTGPYDDRRVVDLDDLAAMDKEFVVAKAFE